MRIAEDWGELMFELHCLSKGSAKRQFREDIRYSFGGLCAYCRERRANTIDHLKPRTAGGSDLRSNLVPCCLQCNHSKGSELNWLEWFQRQHFYNEVARDLIIEWTENRRTDCNEGTHHADIGATVSPRESQARGRAHEQRVSGKGCVKTLKVANGAEKRHPKSAARKRDTVQG